jgi:hypothetical protein
MGRSALIVVAAVLVVLFLFNRGSLGTGNQNGSQPSGNSRVTGHLSVVPTIRSVTVSPGSVNFGDCTGGGGATNSTQGAMGYPNGSCYVGGIGVNQTFPITVTYTGLPGNVYVSGSNAVPADAGTQWNLCSPQGQGRPTCSGSQGLPGADQYMIMNTAREVTNASALTTTAACDQEFDVVASGGCAAAPPELGKQTQHEGLRLTGPRTWNDHSTSWTMTITWTAVGS